MEDIRRAELLDLREYFPPGIRVLELGGGHGVQAAVLASWGCVVQSVDLAGRDIHGDLAFPIQDYDGVHIPFGDDSFDIVFSSNVLEHVVSLRELLGETRRVLVSGGTGLHLMPSPAWRFWTSVTHYVSVAQFGWARLRGHSIQQMGCFEGPRPEQVLAQKGSMYALRRAALPGAHGEYPSSLTELARYHPIAWKRVFRSAGFHVDRVWGHGLFYAGYGLMPNLTRAGRRRVARILGSACNVFVTRPASQV